MPRSPGPVGASSCYQCCGDPQCVVVAFSGLAPLLWKLLYQETPERLQGPVPCLRAANGLRMQKHKTLTPLSQGGANCLVPFGLQSHPRGQAEVVPLVHTSQLLPCPLLLPSPDQGHRNPGLRLCLQRTPPNTYTICSYSVLTTLCGGA